jgi:lipopolysaccharide assembly outer membrane protein LptD (OstA)
VNISTSYNLAADSLRWAPIRLTASTRLFGNLVLNYSATFDMYARERDEDGNLTNRRINTFIWNTDQGFLLREMETMNTGLSWTWSSRDRERADLARPASDDIFMQRTVFAPQWSLSVSYNITYRSTFRPRYQTEDIFGRPLVGEPIWRDYDANIMQTLSVSGHLNLTDKWRIAFTSGYDFVSRQLSHTTFNITRNLCCWTMTFSWAPFGQMTFWSFGIRLNSQMLGDIMQYDRQRSHRVETLF